MFAGQRKGTEGLDCVCDHCRFVAGKRGNAKQTQKSAKRPSALWKKARAARQQHIFDEWDSLTEAQRLALTKQLEVTEASRAIRLVEA